MSGEEPAAEADFQAAVEKFDRAVTELATGSGGLPDRLSSAWTHTIGVQAHDIPESLRDQFREMEAVWLSCEPAQLSNEEVEQVARSILLMEAELLILLGSHARGGAARGSG